jgi:hypothetical protein
MCIDLLVIPGSLGGCGEGLYFEFAVPLFGSSFGSNSVVGAGSALPD